jgi:hypothetical protein
MAVDGFRRRAAALVLYFNLLESLSIIAFSGLRQSFCTQGVFSPIEF